MPAKQTVKPGYDRPGLSTDILTGFPFLSLHVRITFQSAGKLPPYSGATLRGGFGYALKRSVCVVPHGDCGKCLIRSRCPYPYIFETPRPTDSTIMTRYDTVPHPFIILPEPRKNPEVASGDSLLFTLTLFGQSVELLPFIILAFENLGKSGLGKSQIPFSLSTVTLALPHPQVGQPIYLPASQELTAIPPIPWELPPKPSTILHFQTPARLKGEGKVLKQNIPFDRLISSLLRRFSMLSYFHAGQEIEADFKALVNAAKEVKILEQDLKWQDFQRYSTRQKQKMNLGGLVGTIAYDQNAIPFYPLLFLGQYLHVGKNTSFGLGKYELIDA